MALTSGKLAQRTTGLCSCGCWDGHGRMRSGDVIPGVRPRDQENASDAESQRTMSLDRAWSVLVAATLNSKLRVSRRPGSYKHKCKHHVNHEHI